MSIPLSILASISVLYALGQTLNVMTLGGLALAVGILVDDATVEIENIHRNLGMGKPLRQAILDGAAQIAGAGVRLDADDLHRVRAGLVPRAAPAASCSRRWRWRWCSRCWRPTCCRGRWCRRWCSTCCRPRRGATRRRERRRDGGRVRPVSRRASKRGFERLRRRLPGRCSTGRCDHRRPAMIALLRVRARVAVPVPFVGHDFFPTVDAGQFRLHVRRPAGHADRADRSATSSRSRTTSARSSPPTSSAVIIDNIGLPNSINLALQRQRHRRAVATARSSSR